jgi:hypothetical protein
VVVSLIVFRQQRSVEYRPPVTVPPGLLTAVENGGAGPQTNDDGDGAAVADASTDETFALSLDSVDQVFDMLLVGAVCAGDGERLQDALLRSVSMLNGERFDRSCAS